MGRKRKAYPDKFKIDAVREALHSGADRTEVAIKYNIAQSTLSEWITMFLEGKILTDEQKALEEKIAILEKQPETILMELGIKGMKPVFKTTRAGKAPYGKFPYLLRNKFIRFSNQVMATDITYTKTPWGMMYFTSERIHQGLNYKTPDEVYEAGLITNRLNSKPMTA